MKRTNQILSIAFLLLLFIGPSIFGLSSIVADRQTEPNMNKDFTISADWYNESWNYRKSVLLSGATGAGYNYTVKVEATYDGHMQTDFDDIRFTDADGETLLNYWLEIYTASTSAVFWVEIPDDLGWGMDPTIYMYYGNDTVSTTSNGTNTFLFFDDFENNNLDRWDNAQSDWSVTGAEKKYGDYSAYVDSGGTDRTLQANFSTKLEYGILIHSYVRFQSYVGNEYPLVSYEDDSTLVYTLYSDGNDWSTYDGVTVKNYEADTQDDNIWYECEIGYDWLDNEFYPYINGVLKTKQDMDSSDASATVTDTKQVGSSGSALEDNDHWLDNYYVRKWVAVEPSVDSFGEEEDRIPPPAWQEAGTAIIRFEVPIFTGSLDALIIFAGLIMIPASTLYLVKGGKDEMSGEKFFFGLIAFTIGWALVIGGIYG